MLNILQYRTWAISADFYEAYAPTLMQWLGAGHSLDHLVKKKSMEDHVFAIEGLLTRAEAEGFPAVDMNAAVSTVSFDPSVGLPVVSSGNKRVALLPVNGVITKNGEMCSYGTKDYQSWLARANASASIDAIILLIDSPGGSVDGTQEFAQAIKDSAKPVGVFTDGLMASAAYWIASQAQAAIVANKYNSNTIGSIGTYALYQNIAGKMEKDGIKAEIIRASKSTNKIGVNSLEPLSDAGRARMQQEVNTINEVFISYVQAARPNVDASVFSADVYDSYKAKQLGLIDSLGTLQTAVNKVLEVAKATNNEKQKQNNNSMSAEEAKHQDEAKIAALEASLTAEQSARATAEQSLASANERVSALESEKGSLQTKVSEHEATIAASVAEVATLKAELEKAPAGQKTTAVAAADPGKQNQVAAETSVDAELKELQSIHIRK